VELLSPCTGQGEAGHVNKRRNMMERNTTKTLALVAVLATAGLSRAELVGSFLFQ